MEQPERFPIPLANAQNPFCTSLVMRKSRFLAQTCHCGDSASARAFVEAIRKRNPDATHNCWAFAAGPPGDSSRIGCSDDGEPHGTAGKPMLNALLHCGIGQICVVVSRWFGGIKLGTGGLARAYQQAVLENAAALPLTVAVAKKSWPVTCAYEWLPQIRRILPHYEASIASEEYGERASLVITAPLDQASALFQALSGLSNGKIRAPD